MEDTLLYEQIDCPSYVSVKSSLDPSKVLLASCCLSFERLVSNNYIILSGYHIVTYLKMGVSHGYVLSEIKSTYTGSVIDCKSS